MIDTSDPTLLSAVLANFGDPIPTGQELAQRLHDARERYDGLVDSGQHQEAHALNMEIHALAMSGALPAATQPAGHFLCCPICGGPHPATQSPQVALVKYGMGVWEAYLEDRAAFLRLVQWATAPRLALMGKAVAFYLSHRWRHDITAYQVLVGWRTRF